MTFRSDNDPAVDFAPAAAGAEAAASHADREIAGWRAAALERVRVYAEHRPELTTEAVRVLAEKRGFPTPPDPRAWGAVAMAAKRAGYIEGTGRTVMSTSTTSNTTEIKLWKSRLYMGVPA